MASIPFDEVIAHLHGVGSEYIVIDSSEGNPRERLRKLAGDS